MAEFDTTKEDLEPRGPEVGDLEEADSLFEDIGAPPRGEGDPRRRRGGRRRR